MRGQQNIKNYVMNAMYIWSFAIVEKLEVMLVTHD